LGLNGNCDDKAQSKLAKGAADCAAAAADDGKGGNGGITPRSPAVKRLRLDLPSNGDGTAAAAVAAAAADGAALAARAVALAAQSPLPALTASRLERELEKALRAFIRIK
jgi:hypothetical protein